jgi:hypothetical protein
MTDDRSDDVARLLAELDSAGDDRELFERFDATSTSPDLDNETRRAFLFEVRATGWRERVEAARERYVASINEAIKEDHERRMDAVVERVLKDPDA